MKTLYSLLLVSISILQIYECQSNVSKVQLQKKIYVVLGSTRDERSADKITRALLPENSNPNATLEVVDLRDFPLPFLADVIAPASRTHITDPQVKKWSEKISQADAYIFIVPEYNSGYPGVLKNALDSLYKEWTNKPVGFIGYSGGPSGGKSAVAQLKTVAQAFKMIPVGCDIFIPNSWKAFNSRGKLANQALEQEFTKLVNQLVTELNK